MPLEAPRLRRRNPESLPDPDSNRGRPTKATVHNEWGYKGRAISIRLPFITRCSRFRRVSDRRVNAKRGLNRLFVALTVLWAAYCLVGYPFQKRFEAVNKWNADLKMCSEQTQGEMKECYDLVQQNYLTAVAPWQLPYFYSWAWPFLLAAALGVPLVVYLLCFALAAASVWVARGFKTSA
jgi:hypothetical protein